MADFRAMAAPLMSAPPINPDTSPDSKSISPRWNAETLAQLNHPFHCVENDLGQMCVMEVDRGILSTGKASEITIAHKDFSYPRESAVSAFDARTVEHFLAQKTLAAKTFEIYRLGA
jgi:hypothetical protein